MHIDQNPHTRMRIEQLLVCCIVVVCCHCCADYNNHYLIRSVTTLRKFSKAYWANL